MSTLVAVVAARPAVAHSWFTRFRKLLVRYEKLQRSYVASTMLAAAIISFRHVSAKVDIGYG